MGTLRDLLCCATALLVPATEAMASCQILDATLSGPVLRDDPFEAAPEETYTLSVQTNGSCPSVTALAEIPAAGARPSGVPVVRLTDGSGGTTYYSNASGASGPFASRTDSSGNATVQFAYVATTDDATIRSPKAPTPVPLDVRVAGAGGDPAGRVFQVQVDVETLTHLTAHFAGTGASGMTAHILDIGTLGTSGTTAGSIGIALETNVDYDIGLTSDNAGSLKRAGKISLDWTIPYTVALDGTPAPVAPAGMPGAPRSFARPADGTPMHGIDVEVSGADVTDKRAGTYRDVLTITITP